MKVCRFILPLLLTFFLLSSCFSEREDILFGASDELHYIKLYEKGKEFVILHNGVNTEDGHYSLNGDTLILTYSNEKIGTLNAPSNKEILTRKLLIDTTKNRIESLDSKLFCANIYLNRILN